MGTTLTGKLIADTYDALLKVTDNNVITGIRKRLTDGFGNDTPLLISSTDVQIDGNFILPGTTSQYVRGDGSIASFPSYVSSVGLSMPSAFTVSNSPITSSGTITVTAAGTASQYIRGDGTLADFGGGSGGGGASVSYYLNGSINQGTIGGVTYYEMNKSAIIGAGTNFTRNTNGYIASFLTDANDPALLKIPGGNWNLEFYFSASSGGGTPSFYVELYKYDGSIFTLIASSSTNPEVITGGTATDAYFTSLAVPETVLTLTDRLAVRIYVNTAGRTITLHTEDNNLCQVITTFTTGLTALNNLTSQVQFFSTGTTGTDFNISSSINTHTFNLPTASSTNRGLLSSSDWTNFNNKLSSITRTQVINALATGGSPFEFLKSDGSVDTNSYVTFGRTLTINGTTQDLSANRTFNVGTVTSVSGTGTVSGLTLTGSVTSSGSLTLGGTLTLTSGQVTSALGYTPVPNTRTLTINGTTFDLTADRSWTIPTGVTGSGTAGRIPVFATSTSIGDSQIFTAFDETAGAMIGIGATPNASPIPSRLYVSGNSYMAGSITATGAISTSESITASSIVRAGGTASQLLAANGSVVTAGTNITISGGTISATGGLSGSLTTNFIPKATGATSLGNSTIQDDGTNVSLSGGLTSSTFLRINRDGSDTLGSGAFIALYNTAFTSAIFQQLNASNGLDWRSTTGLLMRLTSAGNVGIGTSSPTRTLDINGDIALSKNGEAIIVNDQRGTDSISIRGAANINLQTFNGSSMVERMRITSAGNVGIGTSSPNLAGGTIGLSVNSSNYSVFELNQNNARAFYIYSNAGESYISNFGAAPMIFRTTDTERMRITSGGNVGIGTSTPGRKLQVVGEISSDFPSNGTIITRAGGTTLELHMRPNQNNSAYITFTEDAVDDRWSIGTTAGDSNFYFRRPYPSSAPMVTISSSGTITASGDVLAFSDISVKENIRPIDNALERVLNSRGVVYDRIDNEEKDNIGFIAQELEINFPELVSTKEDGTKSVKYQNAVAILFEAIKQQQAQIDELKKLLN